ncbi:MAG: DUF4388 domain-containing protein [Thermoanaerobaculales bacterium]|nr:DUF4388 domain-containing protein [Thermoanaerobaculales bacterium]
MRSDLVYVVHSEPGVAAQLSQALLSSDFKVVSMTTEEEAQASLSGQQFMLPDAILTPLGDIESGDSILIQLFLSNPLMEQIPLVVVASADKDERRRALRLGLLSVIFPPYDQEEVALTTGLAIEKHRNEQLLFGSLSQLSVPDLLQTAEVGRRSGTITFQNNGSKGQVWLRDGLVVNAHIDDRKPSVQAVYELVLWDKGTFEANFGEVEVEEEFALPPSELVLEAMRRQDEARVEETAGLNAGGDVERGEETLELALMLVNVVSSYTANYLDKALLQDRLEDVRQTMLSSEPVLERFRFTETGAVVFGDPAETGDPDDILAATVRWCSVFFQFMDAAVAWRFDRKRLFQLINPWREVLETRGVFGEFGDLPEEESAEDEHYVMASHERPLPLGCFLVNTTGSILDYGAYGPQMGRIDSQRIISQQFTAILPAAIVQDASDLMSLLLMEDWNEDLTSGRFDFELGHLPVSVRLVFLRSPVEGHVILTVNRIHSLGSVLSPQIERDPLLGTLTDGNNHRILAVNEDFLCAIESLLALTFRHRHQELLQRFGKQWGLRHALRVEQIAQHQFGMTLREVESHVALELLSGSIGILGLGTFDADLSFRDRGIIVVTHISSPFPSFFTSTSGVACSILAGFHAAVLSYLAGRSLAAREVCCSRSPGEPCIFVIATEDRLSKLFVATPGSPDHALLDEIASGKIGGQS